MESAAATISTTKEIACFPERCTEYKIDQTIKKIKKRAAQGNQELTSILCEEPAILKSIGRLAFHGSLVRKVIIPDSVEVIKSGAFWCGWLEEVEITNKSRLKKIQDKAFATSKIKRFFVARSVQEIGRKVFWRCENLSEIEVHPYNQLFLTYDKCLYQRCCGEDRVRYLRLRFVPYTLSEMTLNDEVRVLERLPFGHRQKLEKLIINKSSRLEELESACLASTSIRSLYIPGSVKKIGSYCFDYEKIETFDIDPKNEYYCVIDAHHIYARRKTEDGEQLELDTVTRFAESFELPPGVSGIGSFALENLTKMTQCDLCNGESAIVIGDRALANTGLTELLLPAAVDFIGKEAFESPNLEKIEVEAYSQFFESWDGILFSKGYKTVVNIPMGKKGMVQFVKGKPEILPSSQLKNRSRVEEVCLKDWDGTEDIPDDFLTGSSIRSIVLPGTLKEIPEKLFEGCTRLEIINVLNTGSDVIHDVHELSGYLYKKETDENPVREVIVFPHGQLSWLSDIITYNVVIRPYCFENRSIKQFEMRSDGDKQYSITFKKHSFKSARFHEGSIQKYSFVLNNSETLSCQYNYQLVLVDTDAFESADMREKVFVNCDFHLDSEWLSPEQCKERVKEVFFKGAIFTKDGPDLSKCRVLDKDNKVIKEIETDNTKESDTKEKKKLREVLHESHWFTVLHPSEAKEKQYTIKQFKNLCFENSFEAMRKKSDEIPFLLEVIDIPEDKRSRTSTEVKTERVGWLLLDEIRMRQYSDRNARMTRVLFWIAMAIRMMEVKKISHKLITPGNVYVNRKCSRLKVGSWPLGSAKTFLANAKTNDLWYVAPEVLNDKDVKESIMNYFNSSYTGWSGKDLEHDAEFEKKYAKADVFSFGLIMYEVLTRSFVFRNDAHVSGADMRSHVETKEKQLERMITSLKTRAEDKPFSANVVEVLENCIAKESDRWTIQYVIETLCGGQGKSWKEFTIYKGCSIENVIPETTREEIDKWWRELMPSQKTESTQETE